MEHCEPVMKVFEGLGAAAARSRSFGRDVRRVGTRVGKMSIGAGAIGGVGYLGYKGYERRGRSSGANGLDGRSSGGMQ